MKWTPRMSEEDKKFLLGISVGVAFGIALLLVLAVWNLAI